MNVRVKKGVFALLALGLPLVGLAVLEGVLEGSGLGADTRMVFRTVPEQPAYQVLNSAYLRRYFNNTFEPTVAFNPFRKEKPDGLFRVIVLGGSSAAGFPYRFYLGFPARLQRRLEAYALGQPIEVINLGLTAANSYTLWDLQDAVVAQQPDAVIIYAGHNEYYGAFGVGSAMNPVANRIWVKRLALQLKQFVLYNGLERLLTRNQAPKGEKGGTLMSRAIRDADITLGSPVYQAGLAQFETNMRAVLQTFREAGIPVYLGTLASNLKDQVPLGEKQGAPDDFMRGRTLWEQGDTTGARAAFLEAKEKDEIRFRAPEALNAILQDLAREDGVTLVDIQRLARTASESSIEDQSFFDDHLHPGWRGYDLMAGAFFDALKAHPGLQPSGVSFPSEEAPKPSAFERAFGFLQVFSIQAGYPFNYLNTPEQEEMALRSMLLEYRASSNYQDTLVYKTIINEQPVEEVIPTVISIARTKGDTLTALLLYRSMLHWRRFDEALMAEAVAFAGTAARPEHVRVGEEIVLQALNVTGKTDYFIVLASLKMSQNLLEEAGRLVAMAEARDPEAAQRSDILVRLQALQGALPRTNAVPDG